MLLESLPKPLAQPLLPAAKGQSSWPPPKVNVFVPLQTGQPCQRGQPQFWPGGTPFCNNSIGDPHLPNLQQEAEVGRELTSLCQSLPKAVITMMIIITVIPTAIIVPASHGTPKTPGPL